MNSTQDFYLLSTLFYTLINSESFSSLSRLLFHSSVSSHPATTNSVRHSSQKHFKSSPYVANPFVAKEIWNIFLLENFKEYQIDRDNKSGWKVLLETLNDGSIAAVRNLIESLDSTKNSIKSLNPIVLETTVISLLYIRYFAEPWMSKLLSPSSKSTSPIINSLSTPPTPRLKELLNSVILKLKHERLQGLQYPKFWASVFTNCNLRFYDVEVTDPARNTTTLHPFSLFWNGILELIRISQLIKQNFIPNVFYTYSISSNGFEKQLSTDAKRTIPPEKLSTLINESISVMTSPYSDQLSNIIKQINLSIISNFGIHMPLSWFHPKLLNYSMSTLKRIVPSASNSNSNLSIQDLQILYDAFFVLSCWIRRRNRNDDDNAVERYLGYSDRIINLLKLPTQKSNYTKDYEPILSKLATSNFIGLSYVIAPSPTSPPSPSPIANSKSAIVSLSTSLLAKLCKSPYSLTIMNSEYYFPTLSHLLQFVSSETVKSVLSALLASWDATLPDQTDLVVKSETNPELEIPELAIRWYQCFQYAWKKRIEDFSHVKSKQKGHSEIEIWFHNVVCSLELPDMTRPKLNDEKTKEPVELKSSLQYVMSVLTAASVFRIFTSPELQFHKLSFTKSYAKLEEVTITGLASIPSLTTSNLRSTPPADGVQATAQSATSIIENDIIVYLSIQVFPYIYKFHQIFDSSTLSFYANAVAVFLVSSKNGLSLDFIFPFTINPDRSSMGISTSVDSTVDTTVYRNAIALIEAKTRSIYWNNLNRITSLLSVLLPNIPLTNTRHILQSFAMYTQRLNVEHTKTFLFWDQVCGTDKSRKNDTADRKRAEKLYWEVMKKLVFVFTLVGCDAVVIRDKQVKNWHPGGSNLFSNFSLSLRFDKNSHSTTQHDQIEEMTFLLLSMLQSLSFIVDYFDSQGYRFDSFEKLLDDVVKELIIPTNKSTQMNTFERPIDILSRLECTVVDGNMFLSQSSMSELPIIDPSKSLFHIRLITRLIHTLPSNYLAKYISTFVTPIFSIPLPSSASSQSILQSLYDSSHLLLISCFDAFKINVVRQFWFWYFEYCLEEFNRDGDKFVLYKGVGGVGKGLGGVKVEILDDEHYKDKDKEVAVADGIDLRDGNEKALDYILQRLKKELEDWKGLHVRLNRLSPSKATPPQPIVDKSEQTSMLTQTQSQTPSYLFLLKTIASLTTVVPIQYFYKLQSLLTELLEPDNWDANVNWGVRYIDLLSIVFAEVSKTGLKLDVESFNASNSNFNTANSVNSNEPSPNPSSPSSTESSTSSTSPSALSSNPPFQPPPQRQQPQNPYTISPSYLAQLTTDIDFTNPNPNPNNPSSLGNPIDSVDLLRREEISRWWNKLVWKYLGYRETERFSHSDKLKDLNGKEHERDGKSKVEARL